MTDLIQPVETNDHLWGVLTAPAQLVVYGDYECPYCAEATELVNTLKESFGDQLLYVFRNFPLAEIHSDAMPAAEAAEAAGAQGMFWKMHEMLYENQADLDEASLVDYARRLELDIEKFKRQLQSRSFHGKIRKDLRTGNASGVDGTPTLFLNGVRWEGPIDLEGVATEIEALIEKADPKSLPQRRVG